MSENTDKHLIKSMSRWASENGSGVVAEHIEILAKEVNDLEQKLAAKEQSLADANDQLERMRERYRELEATYNRCFNSRAEYIRENAELEQANRWIPVSERLPASGVFVLVWLDKDTSPWVGFYESEWNQWYCQTSTSIEVNSVTRWQPITPPKEQP